MTEAVGALLTAGVGAILLLGGPGDGLTHLSYDSPFALRPALRPQEAILVYLDEASHKVLDQPFNAPWS